MADLGYWQSARYRPGQQNGHYESWFLRANHPSRADAFWIRYTIFSPHGRSDEAVGELWAIHFDGVAKRIRASKSQHAIRDCRFSSHGLDVSVGSATLTAGAGQGAATSPHNIRWNLSYRAGSRPMVFLQDKYYESSFPKAKAVSQRPHVIFNGTLEVDGEIVNVDNWVGSENHNWGSKHTDAYAWSQVVGFDDAPNVFFECATARLKFGPVWTPPLTICVLRAEDTDFKVNGLLHSVRASGAWKWKDDACDWHFDTRDDKAGIRMFGHVRATRGEFVGLTYRNPPGGSNACLNSKIASCIITLERAGKPAMTVSTRHRAAFEILTNDPSHGIPLAI